MNLSSKCFLLSICCSMSLSVHAETALEYFTPSIRGVEASSIHDPAFANAENVTDWNWLSRWQPEAEGTGAWIRIDFQGEVPVGGVYLVDEANARGTVEAVRFEFSDGTSVDYAFPVGHDPNMPQAGLLQWGTLDSSLMARPDKGSHFARFEKPHRATSMKVIITKTRDNGLTKGLAEVRPVVIAENDAQPLADDAAQTWARVYGYAMKTNLPSEAFRFDNNEFSLTVSEKTGLITEFMSKVPTTIDLLASSPRSHDYLTGWKIAGPYEQEGLDSLALLDHPFAPETAADDAEWQDYEGDRDGLLRLDDTFKWPTKKVVYLKTRVHSPVRQDLVLKLRGDDGIKAWVNGEEVYRNNIQRFVFPYTYKGESLVNGGSVDVTLEEGWNDLLVKVTQEVYEWRLTARFQHPDGSPVEGLEVEGQDIAPNAVLANAPTKGGTLFLRNLDRGWEDRFSVLKAFSLKDRLDDNGEPFRELVCLIAPEEKPVAFAKVRYRIFEDRVEQHIDFRYLVNDWCRYQMGFYMPLDYAQWPLHRDSGWGLDDLGFETSSEQYIRMHGHAYDINWEQGNWNTLAMPLGMFQRDDRYLAYGSFDLYHHLVFGPNVPAPAASPAVFVYPLGLRKGEGYTMDLFFKTFDRETSGYIEGLQWYLTRTRMDDPDMSGIPVRLAAPGARTIPKGRSSDSPYPLFKGDSPEKAAKIIARMDEVGSRHMIFGGWDAWVHPPEEFEGAEWTGYRQYEMMSTELYSNQFVEMKAAGLYPYLYLNGFLSPGWNGKQPIDPDDDKQREFFMERLKELISLTRPSGIFWDGGAPPMHWKWPNNAVSSDPRGDQGRGWMKLHALMGVWMKANYPEMMQMVNTMAGGSLSDFFCDSALVEDFVDHTTAVQGKAFGIPMVSHHGPMSYRADTWKEHGVTFADLKGPGMTDEMKAGVWDDFMYEALRGLAMGITIVGPSSDLVEHDEERRSSWPDYTAMCFFMPQHLQIRELNRFNELITATGNLPETHVFKSADPMIMGNVWASPDRLLSFVYNPGPARNLDVRISRAILEKYGYDVADTPTLTPIDRSGLAIENPTLAAVVDGDFIRVTGELAERGGILLEGNR